MKYYTPELEEFHVGFEYEILLNSGEWEKSIFIPTDSNFLHRFVEEASFIINEFTRVKYLDEQDIKDLGWEFTSTNGMVIWFHGKEEWFGKEIPGSPLYKYWSYTLTFDSKYQSVKIECGTNNGDTDTFFEGIIKNKSELRKLMKHLGII